MAEKTTVNVIPKEGPFDITQRVKVVFSDGENKSPFHKPGATTMVAAAVAEKFIKKGWAKRA